MDFDFFLLLRIQSYIRNDFCYWNSSSYYVVACSFIFTVIAAIIQSWLIREGFKVSIAHFNFIEFYSVPGYGTAQWAHAQTQPILIQFTSGNFDALNLNYSFGVCCWTYLPRIWLSSLLCQFDVYSVVLLILPLALILDRFFCSPFRHLFLSISHFKSKKKAECVNVVEGNLPLHFTSWMPLIESLCV